MLKKWEFRCFSEAVFLNSGYIVEYIYIHTYMGIKEIYWGIYIYE